MDIVLTTAGIQAVINAQETGTNAVTISEIGVGTGKYTANKEQTQLQAQVKRMPILEGGQAGDNAIHVACKDDGPGSYEVCEFGLFLSDGTLFAVYSQSTPIIAKQESSNLLLAIDMKLEGVSAGNVTFGDVSFSFTAATRENAGIVELATDEETQAGTEPGPGAGPGGSRAPRQSEELDFYGKACGSHPHSIGRRSEGGNGRRGCSHACDPERRGCFRSGNDRREIRDALCDAARASRLEGDDWPKRSRRTGDRDRNKSRYGQRTRRYSCGLKGCRR